jgi:hypothetical protein
MAAHGAKRKPSLDILSFRFCPQSRPSPRQSASAESGGEPSFVGEGLGRRGCLEGQASAERYRIDACAQLKLGLFPKFFN